MIKIKVFTYNNVFAANSYLVSDENNDAVIIDFGYFDKNIFEEIKNRNLNLKAILLTHGHFDHIKGLINISDVPIYIKKEDYELLFDPYKNVSIFLNESVALNSNTNIKIIKNEETLDVLNTPIKVIHTPYHTMGSICFYFNKEEALFSGDTLFYKSIGRYDLPTSDARLMKSSLNKLLSIPEGVKVYPGHGPKFDLDKKDLLTYIKMS